MNKSQKARRVGKIFLGIGIFFIIIFVYSIITRMLLKSEMDSKVERLTKTYKFIRIQVLKQLNPSSKAIIPGIYVKNSVPRNQ